MSFCACCFQWVLIELMHYSEWFGWWEFSSFYSRFDIIRWYVHFYDSFQSDSSDASSLSHNLTKHRNSLVLNWKIWRIFGLPAEVRKPVTEVGNFIVKRLKTTRLQSVVLWAFLDSRENCWTDKGLGTSTIAFPHSQKSEAKRVSFQYLSKIYFMSSVKNVIFSLMTFRSEGLMTA